MPFSSKRLLSFLGEHVFFNELDLIIDAHAISESLYYHVSWAGDKL